MEQIEAFINPLSVCGIVFIIIGIITLKFPPKKINPLYGYRTKKSMKNQLNWTFAQTYSSKKMIISGFIMTLLSINFKVFSLTSKQTIIISFIGIAFSVIYIVLKTENAIRKNETIS